jgi:hypothetical protein
MGGFGEDLCEGLAPVGHGPTEGLLELGTIEQRVERPPCGCGVLRRRDRKNGGEAGVGLERAEMSNRGGSEAEPRGLAGAACVVDAAEGHCGLLHGRSDSELLDVLDHVRGHASQFEAPGGPAVLVVDDTESFALTGKTQDGTQEVVAGYAIDPTGAKDEVRVGAAADGGFAGELSAAVGVQGAGQVRLDVGGRFGSVEDIVGGEVDERRTNGCRFFREYRRCCGVEGKGYRRFRFRLVDCGVRGGVDDPAGADFSMSLAKGESVRVRASPT